MQSKPVQLGVVSKKAPDLAFDLSPLPGGCAPKVLFVYPNVQRVRTVQLGIAVLSACLKRIGVKTRLFDTTALRRGCELEPFSRVLDEFRPDILAYSVRSNEWSLVKELLAEGRSRGITQIVGGPHPTHAPEDTIDHVDALVIGEGEGAITDIVRRLSAGDSITGIPNTWVNTDDGVVKAPKRDLISDLDTIPLPDWRLFDDIHTKQSYIRDMMDDVEVVAAIEGSRGCPYTCTYCANSALMESYAGQGRWRREKSPERIVEELQAFREVFGALDFVYWVDEIWLTGIERLRRFRDAYKSGVGVPFSIMERPECVTEEKIKIISDAGLHYIAIGLESGDEELRSKLLQRHTKLEVLRRAFILPKRYGIRVHAFTMLGLPGQDEVSMMKTWDFMRQILPDTAQFTIFQPLEGTKLYDQVIEMGMYHPDDATESFYDGTMLRQDGIDGKLVNRYRLLFDRYAVRPGVWPVIAFHSCRHVRLIFWLIMSAVPACRRFLGRQLSRCGNLRRCTPREAMRKIINNVLELPRVVYSSLAR